MTPDPAVPSGKSASAPLTRNGARPLATYDPALLRRLATQTQAQATGALVSGIVAGMITGILFGYAGMIIFASPYALVVPGAVVGGAMGILVGRRKAQALKLKAQMALCQIQIEENTRPS